MFSLLLSAVTAFETAKKSVSKRSTEVRSRNSQLRNMAIGRNNPESSPSTDNEKANAENSKSIKVQILSALTAVVAFFEMLPVFLGFITWTMIILCVVVLVIIVFAMMAMVTNATKTVVPSFQYTRADTVAVGGVRGPINWTEAEMASRGMLLTDFEKNLYRMGILAKLAITGYGGSELMTTDNATEEQRILMLLGVSSTETSMKFYNGSEEDLTKVPSDMAVNNLSYGFLGLSSNKSLSDYFPDPTLANAIRTTYSPVSKPTKFYDASFAPWGVAMSARHQQTDLNSYINRESTKALISTALDDWGIQANRGEATALISFFLAQAQYQGASVSEYGGYINFYCALFAASSDDDKKRSFSNWVLDGDDYSESAFRLRALGTTTIDKVRYVSTPNALPESPSTTVTVTLNGTQINEPIWSYLWSKYKDKQGMQNAWAQVKTLSGYDGHGHDRVLNFHYGLNSYLQGVRIKTLLSSKLVGNPSRGSGTFTAQQGIPQAVVDGMSTTDYVSGWYSSASSSAKALMDRLKLDWGTSSFISDPDNPAQKSGYSDAKWGVPFYGQGSRFGEVYGNTKWHWDQSDTINKSGCMIYSHAYVISALTGKLVNPAETASIMLASNALVKAGISSGAMPSVYTKLGLHAEYLGDGVGNFDKITANLKKGGLAVVRMHAGLFTTSENHYVVLSGVDDSSGETLYSMYTSFNTDQAKQMFNTSTLKANMHMDAVIVWK